MGKEVWRIHGSGDPVIEVWESEKGDLYFITDKKDDGDIFCYARLYSMPQFAEWGYNNINYLQEGYGKYKLWLVPKHQWGNIGTYEKDLFVKDGEETMKVNYMREGYRDGEWVNQHYEMEFKDNEGEQVLVSEDSLAPDEDCIEVIWAGAIDYTGDIAGLIRRYPFMQKYATHLIDVKRTNKPTMSSASTLRVYQQYCNYGGVKCKFVQNIIDTAEAQTMLDWYKKEGATACCLHKYPGNQLYVDERYLNKHQHPQTFGINPETKEGRKTYEDIERKAREYRHSIGK